MAWHPSTFFIAWLFNVFLRLTDVYAFARFNYNPFDTKHCL